MIRVDEALVLHHQLRIGERKVWRRVVPRDLRETCMRIFNEGIGHVGATRAVGTMKLHYHWVGQQAEHTDYIIAGRASRVN